MNLSENEKTTVQAASASQMNASASQMNMRREARNQLVFLSAQFLLGMAVNLIGQPSEEKVDGAKAMLADGLVDELHLFVLPVVLGSGKRLFSDNGDGKLPLKLTGSEAYGTGVLHLTYAAA